MSCTLWDFSLEIYARPGVAPALLDLQDQQGVDVLLVLYALWLEQREERLVSAEMEQMEHVLGPWRQEVIEPVRALRQRWRELPEAAGHRETLKELELQAERRQLHRMEELHARAQHESLPAAGTNLAILGQYLALDDKAWLALKAALALA